MKTKALITATIFFLSFALQVNAGQPKGLGMIKDSSASTSETEVSLDSWMFNFNETKALSLEESTEASLDMEAWMLDFENNEDRIEASYIEAVLELEEWMLHKNFYETLEEEIPFEDWMI